MEEEKSNLKWILIFIGVFLLLVSMVINYVTYLRIILNIIGIIILVVATVIESEVKPKFVVLYFFIYLIIAILLDTVVVINFNRLPVYSYNIITSSESRVLNALGYRVWDCKGKALKDPEKWEGFKQIMKEYDIPDWYVKSCEKIKYMFPKAHAAAYVTNAFRIAWFKVHIPLAYYAAYFTIRAKAFDAEFMINGKAKVEAKMREITNLGNAATPKDKEMYDDLELVHEMYERGFEFLPVDLYKSHSTKFQIEDGKLRPPLNSIAGLGTVAAESIYQARLEEPFECIEDMQARSKIGKSITELLEKFGCLKGMTKSNQMSLFV